MREYQRERVRLGRPDVQEVDAQPVERVAVLREGVHANRPVRGPTSRPVRTAHASWQTEIDAFPDYYAAYLGKYTKTVAPMVTVSSITPRWWVANA